VLQCRTALLLLHCTALHCLLHCTALLAALLAALLSAELHYSLLAALHCTAHCSLHCSLLTALLTALLTVRCTCTALTLYGSKSLHVEAEPNDALLILKFHFDAKKIVGSPRRRKKDEDTTCQLSSPQ
jgi:hypothetical protein